MICLSMIVKNEAHCIRRCLESVLWLIDCYKIVDTGSTDNTKEIIREVLDGIPGEIIDSPWTDNFSVHRNEALPTMGFCGMGPEDYVLLMDADDEMVLGRPFAKGNLVEDIYMIGNSENNVVNSRIHLWKLKLGGFWKLARHEILDIPGLRHMLRTEQIKIQIHHDGARSQDPNKALNDALVILEDMKNWPEDSIEHRYYMFLVACCFVDCQLYERALEWLEKYVRIAEEENGLENIWMAHNLIAVCSYMVHRPLNQVVEAYMAAINADPGRLESYFLLARVLADNNSFQSAKMILRIACQLERRPFVLKHMEDWWDQREDYYNEICKVIEEEKNAETANA
jgi:glycosyltransferase involved in cell wall biosynthesis